MATFEKFFDSEVKSRLIKFFIYNPTKFVEIRDVASRTGLPGNAVRSHLLKLQEAGFLKSKGNQAFSISYKFPYLGDLRNLALQFPPLSDEQIINETSKIGKIKLIIIAGILINSQKSRADLLVVGDKISERKFAKVLKMIESSIGREVNYAIMTVQDFKYRRDMFDRFVLDILEFPHRKLINKLKIQ